MSADYVDYMRSFRGVSSNRVYTRALTVAILGTVAAFVPQIGAGAYDASAALRRPKNPPRCRVADPPKSSFETCMRVRFAGSRTTQTIAQCNSILYSVDPDTGEQELFTTLKACPVSPRLPSKGGVVLEMRANRPLESVTIGLDPVEVRGIPLNAEATIWSIPVPPKEAASFGLALFVSWPTGFREFQVRFDPTKPVRGLNP